jgi:transcriptional regulator with XRE-family HTH domain
MSGSTFVRLKRYGPQCRVKRSTRDTILSITHVGLTPVGAARRLQALAALGWSAREISRRTGIWPDNLVAIRLGKRKHIVRPEIIDRIINVYDELHMTIPPPSPVASRMRSLAAGYGWAPPMAWDDIDDPNERPKHRAVTRPGQIDHAIVQRRLEGDKSVRCNHVEIVEIVRIARDRGWSYDKIERVCGISKAERYIPDNMKEPRAS